MQLFSWMNYLKVEEEVKTAGGEGADCLTSVLSYRPEILMFTSRSAPSGRALFLFWLIGHAKTNKTERGQQIAREKSSAQETPQQPARRDTRVTLLFQELVLLRWRRSSPILICLMWR